jgi:hypothetical protein
MIGCSSCQLFFISFHKLHWFVQMSKNNTKIRECFDVIRTFRQGLCQQYSKEAGTVMAAFDAFAMFEEILRRTKYSVCVCLSLSSQSTSHRVSQPCLLHAFVMYVGQNATIHTFHPKALTDLMSSLLSTFMHSYEVRFAKACSMGFFSSSITTISISV